MNDSKSNISDDDFFYQYIELIKKGYSDDSPEVIALLKSRAMSMSNSSKQNYSPNFTGAKSTHIPARKKQYTSNHTYASNFTAQHTNNYYRRQSVYNNSGDYLSHIIIEPYAGNYTILDSHLNIVDSMHSNTYFSFFTQKHKLRKFKKQLKMDFKSYESFCRRNHQTPNPEFKKMYKLTKLYLRLCPDADYQILELLRNNITKINPHYANYQVACAEYLYELAQFRNGNPATLPFDINFCCDKIYSKHVYIANRFDPSSDPVQTFKKIYSRNHHVESEFQSSIRYETKIPNSQFAQVRSIKAPINHDR